MDPAALTGFVTALGGLVTVIGGLQLRRNTLDRAERRQLRADLGRTTRLLGLAVRQIARQNVVIGYADRDPPPMHPELERFIRGEDDEYGTDQRDPRDHRDAAPTPPARGSGHRRGR